MDGTTCWRCGWKQGTAVSITASGAPRSGDVSICAVCEAVSIVEMDAGVVSSRPPNVVDTDRDLLDNEELIRIIFWRAMYITGLRPHKCPNCGDVFLVTYKKGIRRAPRYGDEVICGECSAVLQVGADLSLELKEDKT